MKNNYINQINVLQNKLNIQLAKKFENKIDNQLTAKQVLLLELIKIGVTSTKNLADKLNVSTSAVSQILNKLENKGYVERFINPKNRREIVLNLADKANQYFNDLASLEDEINKEVYGQLSLEDLKQFTNILEKLHVIVKENS
ncbi:MarR family winged helix-turn-helix transcriptional regulator [Peribacillus simplex]|uniref:MarR family winged helix-turn-helix transcriptional regulator n=1 Tax=Peribacillus simplex TaxID=1478 RepID=UPI0024C193C5|nr:MarR family transcriptional regulator [Peribacillus simplex]WHY58595.1 MarR family transcriptional regulator [Peribacillus simplex]